MVLSGDDSRIFYLDQATNLYLPQAGSMATVRVYSAADASYSKGWVLRQPDGHQLIFDRVGYLREDRDRFGNGFRLDYTQSAAGLLSEAICPLVPYVLAPNGAFGPTTGPSGLSSEQTACILLYGLTGFADLPQFLGTPVTTSLFPLTPAQELDPKLMAARDAVVASQAGGYGTPAPFGPSHMRLLRVVDDLGRMLSFTYFDSGANAGLLQKVTGPANTIVEFAYGQPAAGAMPAGLNERFLLSAKRVDTSPFNPGIVAAPSRGYEFEYAWNRASQQMPADLAQSDTAYENFFNNIYNCGYLTRDQCGGLGGSGVMFADTVRMVSEQRRRLYSEAADNIIKVTVRNFATGASKVESETRYARNVYDKDFDRVLLQRWGSTAHPDLPPVAAPPSPPGISWDTSLPIASFAYQGARPQSAANGSLTGDDTETFLPAPLRSRYPLEDFNGTALQSTYDKGLLLPANSSGLPAGVGRAALAVGEIQLLGTSVRRACGIEKLPGLRTRLPGYKPSLDYYDLVLPTANLATPGVAWDQTLKRSRVSCETLSLAETYDVRHNDLATTWKKAMGGEYVLETMTGRRKHTAANANRICTWVKYVDRDGDQHYSGLNFQGRPLVDAVWVVTEGLGEWKVAENLYNADGNVLSQRRTTDVAWTPSAGDTRYSYLEETIAPQSAGTPRPFHWSRRGNVIRIWERPRGGFVFDEVEGSLTQELSLGRFSAYAYEPFFNQVRLVLRGNVKADGTDEPLSRTSFLFDFQEYGESDAQFLEVMQRAQDWGAEFAYANGAFDFSYIRTHQLFLQMFGQDMNGDGDDARTARGVPVRILNESGPGFAAKEFSFIRWAKSGQPYLIESPDFVRTELEYYSVSGIQSGAADLAPTTQSWHNNGFLAQVRRTRAWWPKESGPQRDSCETLPAQYRFLLESCDDIEGGLAALGLSQEAIDSVVHGQQSNTISFNYNFAGHQSAVRTTLGAKTSITTDTDGRVVRSDLFDVRGAHHSYVVEERDAFMRVIRSKRFDGKYDTSLGETVRVFDAEDRVLSECREAVTGGCDEYNTANVTHRWVYTREGDVFRVSNGEGLTEELTRDGRKWPTQTTLISPNPHEGTRQVVTTRDNDANVVYRKFGSGNTLDETRTWDGLNRPLTLVDTQERVWRSRASKRDLRTSSEVDGDAAGPTFYSHDDFGRISRVTKNGITLAEYGRLPGGAVFAESASGRGTRYMTYDVTGRLSWSEDAAGTQALFTESLLNGALITTQSQIRNQGAMTTGQIAERDGLGLPRWIREQGGQQSRTTEFVRNAAGFALAMVPPDKVRTEADYDFLGRVTELREQRVRGASRFETSTYTYDPAGRLRSIVDPAGYETVQLYTGFGEPSQKTGPASTPQISTWEYDPLGRKTRHQSGGQVDMGYRYNKQGLLKAIVRGDPADLNAPKLESFTYDGLGRLEEGVRWNLGAEGALPEAERIVVTRRTYDDANRSYTEEMTVGQHAPKAITSQWLVGANWQRQVTLPSGRMQQHVYDGAGRESALQRASGQWTSLAWQGEFLTSSSSSTANGDLSRLVTLDSLGQSTSLSHDLNGDVKATVGLRRDVMGRIGSSSIEFRASAGDFTSWRGYVYDALGRLNVVHEAGSIPAHLPEPNIQTAMMGSEIESAGSSANSNRWEYKREENVGSVIAIEDGIQPPRFWSDPGQRTPNQTPTSRGEGYRLKDFRVGTVDRSAAHDGAGRLIADDDQRFVFDDLGALSIVQNRWGNTKEIYLYDISGRLVSAIDPVNSNDDQFLNDGLQMVEAFDKTESLKWSATWAPGVDHLLSVAEANGVEVFAVDDGKGSVVGWVDSDSTKLVGFAEYTPEGRGKYTDGLTGGVCNEIDSTRWAKPRGLPFGFHSAYSSSVTGLLYFRNRWYSPEVAEWLSHDPLGTVDTVGPSQSQRSRVRTRRRRLWQRRVFLRI
jgi:RHS repeat-associated protein